MAKSIFDRNPITEMFSSVEEAMKCANSMELKNMLRNSFKNITTDPILGEPKKSKESMSIAIIVGDDSNNLNNINTLENGGKMKKFKYTGRYADGGKKLKPIPADNKGLQALAKKNPKLVMDMGFDPNRIAGETKGKKNKKKGPKVTKNQDSQGLTDEQMDMVNSIVASFLEDVPNADEAMLVDSAIEAIKKRSAAETSDEAKAAVMEAMGARLEGSNLPMFGLNLEGDVRVLDDSGRMRFPESKKTERIENRNLKQVLKRSGLSPQELNNLMIDDPEMYAAVVTDSQASKRNRGNAVASLLASRGIRPDEINISGVSSVGNVKGGDSSSSVGNVQGGSVGNVTARGGESKSVLSSEIDIDSGSGSGSTPGSGSGSTPGSGSGSTPGSGSGSILPRIPGLSLPVPKSMDGMAPNLGAYPDIVYLTRFEAGGKQKMARGYQDVESDEAYAEKAQRIKDEVRLQQREDSITDPQLTPRQRYLLSTGDYELIPDGNEAYADKNTGELKEPVKELSFGTTIGDYVTIYNPGEKMPKVVPMDEVLLASGEYIGSYEDENFYTPQGSVIDDRNEGINYGIGQPLIYLEDGRRGVGSLAASSRDLNPDWSDYTQFGPNTGRTEAGQAYQANIPIKKGGYLGGIEGYENPGYTFANVGLDIRDFQTGRFSDRSATSNRELRRRLREHLAAGKSPETFSVQVRTLDLPEGTQERLNRGILTESSELAFPIVTPTRLEKVPELSTAGMRDFNLADVMSQQQFDKMNELEEKAASGEQLTRRQQRRLNNLQSLYSRGRKVSREERRGTAAGQADSDVASGPTAPTTTRAEQRLNRKSERLDNRITRAQERADRQANTQALRAEIQDKREQLRNIRRGMDGMFFNPMAADGMMMGEASPVIPNGGMVSSPPAFNYAADGMMMGGVNMNKIKNTVRGGSTAASTSSLPAALADAVRNGELSPEQAQKMLMILGEK